MSIEAMKQALEALEKVTKEMLALRDELAERGGRPTQGYHQLLWDSSHKVYTDTAIPAAESLRQAIEQAEQAQPFGYFQLDLRLDAWVMNRHSNKGVAFYTAPFQRQPLTDEQIKLALSDMSALQMPFNKLIPAIARAIERAHGIRRDDAA